MANKKTKRNPGKIIFLFVILIIMMIILLIRSKSHSKENVLNKVILGLDNLNYSYELNNGNTTVQVFGKFEKRTNEKTIEYIDYDSKIVEKTYLDSKHREEYPNNGIEDMAYYKQFIDGYFNNEIYTYKYVGKENLDGQKYIVVKFIDNIAGKAETYFWINTSTNIIEKMEYYQYNNNKKEKIMDTKYDFSSGTNSQDSVKITDAILNEYSSNTNG